MSQTITQTSSLKTQSSISAFDIYDSIVTWIFGVVFLISGIPHWGNSYFFLGSVYAYKLVDPGIGQMIAIGMPMIQLVLAICFLTRTFLDAAHLGTLFLFLCFATVQSQAYLRGLDISCGCFGPDHDTMIGWQTLSVIYGLLVLSIIRNSIIFFRGSCLPAKHGQTNRPQTQQRPRRTILRADPRKIVKMVIIQSLG